MMPSEAQQLSWVVYSNPSPGPERPESVCEDGEYIYVVGSESSPDWRNTKIRIEKRLKLNGELDKISVTDLSKNPDGPFDCIIINGKLYVVGYDTVPRSVDAEWIILMYDLVDLGLISYVRSNPSEYWDDARSITSDGKYLYIVGIDSMFGPGNSEWRIEKRAPDDLSLIKVYRSNPSTTIDQAWKIEINPLTGELWVIGSKFEDRELKWRVEILTKDLELVKVIEPGINGSAYSITFDEYGNAYVADFHRTIVKFDKQGNEVKRIGFLGENVLYANGNLYVFQEEPADQYWRLVMYVLDDDLRIITSNILKTEIYLETDPPVGKIVSDSENVYVVRELIRRDSAPGNSEWMICSFKLLSKTVTRSITTTTFYITKTVEKVITENVISTQILERTITETKTDTKTIQVTYYPKTALTTAEVKNDLGYYYQYIILITILVMLVGGALILFMVKRSLSRNSVQYQATIKELEERLRRLEDEVEVAREDLIGRIQTLENELKELQTSARKRGKRGSRKSGEEQLRAT
jgi:DNA-binding beta-propeller fold protein YncE